MHGVLHVLATVVLAPYAGLAAAFVLMGHAIAQGDLWSVFDMALMHAAWIIPWGMLAFALALVAVAVLGAVPRTRAAGAAILAALAAASLVVLVVLGSGPLAVDDIPFLLPAIVVLVYAAWRAVPEQRAPVATP